MEIRYAAQSAADGDHATYWASDHTESANITVAVPSTANLSKTDALLKIHWKQVNETLDRVVGWPTGQ